MLQKCWLRTLLASYRVISKTQPSSTKAVICLHSTSATKKVECRPIVCYQYWTTNYIVILEVKGIPGRYDTPFCCCTSCTQCSRHLMYCLNTLESNGWLYSIQDVMQHFSNTIEITIDVTTTSLIHTHITKCTVENLSTRCMAQIGEARLSCVDVIWYYHHRCQFHNMIILEAISSCLKVIWEQQHFTFIRTYIRSVLK